MRNTLALQKLPSIVIWWCILRAFCMCWCALECMCVYLNAYCWPSNCYSLLCSWSSSYIGIIINEIHYDAFFIAFSSRASRKKRLKFSRMGKLNIWIKRNNFIIYRFHCAINWSIQRFNNKHWFKTLKPHQSDFNLYLWQWFSFKDTI